MSHSKIAAAAAANIAAAEGAAAALGAEAEPVLAASLQKHAAIQHGFFTRRGGVSGGLYQSLNCGFNSQDKRENVAENRRRAAGWFGLIDAALFTPAQHHSADVAVLDAPWAGAAPAADAIITRRQGAAIGVLTADCGTVLFYEPQAQMIGAAHAGWKGALAGILQNTVDAMVRLGAKAENIIAASGPSISPQNYEVGEEFRQAFLAQSAANSRYFTPWTGKTHNLNREGEAAPAKSWRCDLWAYIHDRLAEKGVQAEDLRICTYADEARFYSFRRATHRGEPDYGRQLSAIALR